MKALVTGGTGMVGRHLTQLLVWEGYDVTTASLDDELPIEGVAHYKVDLTQRDAALSVCRNQDVIFHLAGIKGSPKKAKERPAAFMIPMLQFDNAIITAAATMEPEWFLYTSSIGVYPQSERPLIEDDSIGTWPSPNDTYAGWAKRTAEMQLYAYRAENDWKDWTIVRPANIYGPYDNYTGQDMMVIPSLIRRALDQENPFKVWGNGTPVRDFVYAEDVARAMLALAQRKAQGIYNIGTEKGTTIADLVETILEVANADVTISYETGKPAGDPHRVLNVDKIHQLGVSCMTPLKEGLKLIWQHLTSAARQIA